MHDRKFKLKISGLFLKMEEKKSLFLLVYTVVFLSTFIIVFAPFIITGKSLIWRIDGYEQHLKALMYIRKYCTEFVLSHKLPAYDFNIGLGANPFTTLTYYGFFDPINLVSVIIPLKYTEYLYSFLTVLRLYLSGLAFVYMCRYFGNKRWYSIIGAMIYITTAYVLVLCISHPFFLNPMIYFPLMIVGLNKILKKEKPYLFIFSISFSALSGFYFLYMMTIMLFVYANVRFFELNKNTGNKMKCYFLSVFRVVMYYVLSCGLAAIVLFPHILAFLNSNRVGKVESLYGENFGFLKYIGALFYVCAGHTYLSISSILFFTIILAFFKYKKERPGIIFLMILSVLGLGISWIGKLMNGFSYPSNRWMFGTALLLAYLFVITLPELMEKKESKWMLPLVVVFNIGYFLIAVFSKKMHYAIANAVILDMIYILLYKLPIYFGKRNKKFFNMSFTVLILVIVLGNAAVVSWVSYNKTGFINSYMKHDNYKKYMESQEVRFKNSKQKEKADGIHEFYRVDGSDFKVNLGMIAGIPNSVLYFSIMNPYIAEFVETLQIADHHNEVYILGMDGRAVAGNLISNKFFVASDKETGEVPYGYKYKEKVGKYKIYRNQNFLPFGYTYDSYVTYDEAEEYFSLDKETNMLDYVYLEEEIPQIRKGRMKKYVKEIDYTIETGNDVVYKEKEYIDFASSKKEKKSDKNKERYFKLLFEEEKNKETYLYLDTFLVDTRYYAKIDFKSDKVKKRDYMLGKKSEFYFNRNNYLFHIGNANKKKRNCSIYLDKNEKFPISDIKVLSVSLEDYEEKIKRLKKDCLQNVEFGVNRVTGEISLTEPKILAMSIPYEKGWTAYVDGKKAEILRGNYMFSCLALDKGKHKIEMRYRPYGMETAVMITILSVIGLGCVIVYNRRKDNVSIGNRAML